MAAFGNGGQLNGTLDVGIGVVTGFPALTNGGYGLLKLLRGGSGITHGIAAAEDGAVKAKKFYIFNGGHGTPAFFSLYRSIITYNSTKYNGGDQWDGHGAGIAFHTGTGYNEWNHNEIIEVENGAYHV